MLPCPKFDGGKKSTALGSPLQFKAEDLFSWQKLKNSFHSIKIMRLPWAFILIINHLQPIYIERVHLCGECADLPIQEGVYYETRLLSGISDKYHF